MNGKELLEGLGDISPEFYNEAENALLPRTAARKKLRRPFLAAALIAVSLLLAGCTAVVLMKMQDLKVGEQEATRPVFATDGVFEGYEEYTEQVLTIAGLNGSVGYQAALEWFQFKQDYDPNEEIRNAVWGNEPEFPAEYDAYRLYSEDMRLALDQLVQKHGLKLAGPRLDFRTVKNLCSALGLDKLLTTDNEVSVKITDGDSWENGNFALSLDIALPEDPDNGITNTWGEIHWNRKDCFSDDVFYIEEAQNWREWNYKTSSGTEVLIMRSEMGRDWILCDKPEATLAVQVETSDYIYNETGVEYFYLTDKQVEQIADAIDFGIQPRVATQEDVANQEGVPNGATQDGYTVELKSFETDGVMANIVIGITAPEGVDIVHGNDGYFYDIRSATWWNFLEPENGKMGAGSSPMNPRDDGDGQDNTQDFVIEAVYRMMDGSKPFAPGMVWNLRFEDLVHTDWSAGTDTVLAEGEWLFPITVGEEDGDFREIEFVPEPITVQAGLGMTEQGDIMGDVQLVSFTLRSLSATSSVMEGTNGDMVFTDAHYYAVMKDGTKVELQPTAGAGEDAWYINDTPIDLNQVDHLLLADGTKLPAPQ